MRIRINNEPVEVDDDATVETLASRYAENAVAVARNRQVVPRSEWASTPLQRDDEIEILMPLQGG